MLNYIVYPSSALGKRVIRGCPRWKMTNVKDFCRYFNHGPTSQSEIASNVGNYNLLATSRLILNSVDVQCVALSWVK